MRYAFFFWLTTATCLAQPLTETQRLTSLCKVWGFLKYYHPAVALTSRQVDSVMKPLMQARAIIFDLRNYPQGTYWLIGRYLTDKRTPFARFTGPDMQFPGTFREVGSAKMPTVREKSYRGKVLVLVDEEAQSHAEFTAMAFRLVPNAVLVGSPTAGADGNISWVPLPGGYRTAFSGIGVYYPDGLIVPRIRSATA